MRKVLLTLGVIMILIGCGFILLDFITPHTTTVMVPQIIQVPKQVTVQKEERIASANDLILSGGYFVPLPNNGIYIEPGKTFKISWSADGNLYVYILTETQFQYFKAVGTTPNYEAYDYGREGTISLKVRHGDKYYGVVSNPIILGPSIKLYEAQATITWQENSNTSRKPNNLRSTRDSRPFVPLHRVYTYSGRHYWNYCGIF